MRKTQLDLDRLRHSAMGAEGAARYSGPRAWRLLRRTLERIYRSFEGLRLAAWPAGADSRPEWERRRRELEARALRTETAQRELESRQKSLDSEWSRVFSELESVHEGWLTLHAELPAGEKDSDSIGVLQERLARLEALWGELLQEEAHLARERGLVDRLWRWLVGVWVPSIEDSLPDGPARQAWASIRRRITDLDRRWRISLSELKRTLVEEEAAGWRERLEESERRAEALSRELLAQREGRGDAEGGALAAGLSAERAARAEGDLRALRLEKEDLRAQLNRLTERLQTYEKAVEASRKKGLDAEARMRAAERQLQKTSASEESLLRENTSLRRIIESVPGKEQLQGAKEENLSTRLMAALSARRKALLGQKSAQEQLEGERLRLKERLDAVRDAWQGRAAELKERALAAEDQLCRERTLSEREKAAFAASVRELQAERDEWRRRLDRSIAEFMAGKPVADDLVRRGYEERLKALEEELEKARRAQSEELDRARLAFIAERDARRRFGAEAAVLRRERDALRLAVGKAEEAIARLKKDLD
jgi:hypothetical protein